MKYLPGDGTYSLAVVGESHYQQALIDIAGPQIKEGRTVKCQAILNREDDNPYDSNAVSVEIGGDTVGYIPRALAPAVRLELSDSPKLENRTFVDAVIRGGRPGQHYGVWLDLPIGKDDQEELVEIVITDLTYMPGIGVVLDAFPAKVPKSEAPAQPAPQVRVMPKVKQVDRKPMQIGATLGILAAFPLHYVLGWEWVFAFLMAVLWCLPLGVAIGSAFSRKWSPHDPN